MCKYSNSSVVENFGELWSSQELESYVLNSYRWMKMKINLLKYDFYFALIFND